MASAQDIVGAAYALQGAPYRQYDGGSIPMWLNDGRGDPPPAWHLNNVGVMGADLITHSELMAFRRVAVRESSPII
jgi:hypothetical protein